MTTPLVSLLMGSDSDMPTVQEACKILRDFRRAVSGARA